MKGKLMSILLMLGLMVSMASASTVIFDVSTDAGFNNWIAESSNLTVTNETLDFNDSSIGTVTLEKFEVASHDNLELDVSNLNGTNNATVLVEGINSTDDSVTDNMTFTVDSMGVQTFNTTGLEGDYTQIEISEDSADSDLVIESVTYRGTLPDDGTVLVGGTTDSSTIMGYDIAYWVVGILVLLAAVVWLS